MSSSSPDPSSSLNTTCFPWRTTTLLPEKPSTFKTTASSSGLKGFSTSSDFGLELLEPFQQGRPTKGSCLHVPVAGELKAGFWTCASAHRLVTTHAVSGYRDAEVIFRFFFDGTSIIRHLTFSTGRSKWAERSQFLILALPQLLFHFVGLCSTLQEKTCWFRTLRRLEILTRGSLESSKAGFGWGLVLRWEAAAQPLVVPSIAVCSAAGAVGRTRAVPQVWLLWTAIENTNLTTISLNFLN